MKMQQQQPNSDYLGFYRELMHPNNQLYNPGRKSQQIKQDATTRLAQMGITDPNQQKAFLSAGRRAYNQALGRQKAQKTQWTDADRTEHLNHKNSVSSKWTEKLRSVVGNQYPDPFKSHMFNTWNGKYPQTLGPNEREEAGRMFAEMTGTLGWMPTYDKKLAAVNSAQQVFNPNDYDIQAYDMDNNPMTPMNVIIRKKNSDGTVGPIIAANGYRLPNATPSQQLRRLKEMEYYDTHATVDARKQQKYGAFLKAQGYSKQSRSVMSDVKEFIKYVISSFKEYPAAPPAYFLLQARTAPNSNQVQTFRDSVFQFTTVAWNTLIARTARLFLLYQCYCRSPQIQNATTAEAITYNNYVANVQQEAAAPPEFNYEVIMGGKASYFQSKLLEPHIELAMFRDTQVANLIRACIAHNKEIHDQQMKQSKANPMSENNSSVYYRIRDLMSLVIMHTMRFGAAAVAKMAGFQDIKTLKENALFEMVDGDELANLRAAIDTTYEPISVSAISNADLVKKHIIAYKGVNVPGLQGIVPQPAYDPFDTTTSNPLAIDNKVTPDAPISDDEWGNSQVHPTSSSSSSSAFSPSAAPANATADGWMERETRSKPPVVNISDDEWGNSSV